MGEEQVDHLGVALAAGVVEGGELLDLTRGRRTLAGRLYQSEGEVVVGCNTQGVHKGLASDPHGIRMVSARTLKGVHNGCRAQANMLFSNMLKC